MLDRISKDFGYLGIAKKKHPTDINQRAKSIVDLATSDPKNTAEPSVIKNAAAVALGIKKINAT